MLGSRTLGPCSICFLASKRPKRSAFVVFERGFQSATKDRDTWSPRSVVSSRAVWTAWTEKLHGCATSDSGPRRIPSCGPFRSWS